MKPSKILFRVNEYDRDGDLTNKGIFLCFGETVVKAAENIEEFRSIIDHFEAMIEEIESEYPEARGE